MSEAGVLNSNLCDETHADKCSRYVSKKITTCKCHNVARLFQRHTHVFMLQCLMSRRWMVQPPSATEMRVGSNVMHVSSCDATLAGQVLVRVVVAGRGAINTRFFFFAPRGAEVTNW